MSDPPIRNVRFRSSPARVEQLIPGLELAIGTELFQRPVAKGQRRVFRSSPTLFLHVRDSLGPPLSLELVDGDIDLRLSRMQPDLVFLSDDRGPLVSFARLGGIYEIPADFQGTLVFLVTYETTFPQFPALGSIRGIDLRGNLANINDWSALGAATLESMRVQSNAPGLAPHLRGTPRRLCVTAALFDEFAAPALRAVEHLSLMDADLGRAVASKGAGTGELDRSGPLRKAFGLPALKNMRLQLYLPKPENESRADLALLCGTLASGLVPTFPQDLQPKNSGEERSYWDGYMSNVFETVQEFGDTRHGVRTTEVLATTSDGAFFDSSRSVRATAYGLGQHAAVSVEAGTRLNIDIAGPRGSVLATLAGGFGFEGSTSHRTDPPHDSEGTAAARSIPGGNPSAEAGPAPVDTNRLAFEKQSARFATIVREVVLPILERAAARLRTQGTDLELTFDHEHVDSPLHYRAIVYLMLWTKGRTAWALFQYSQAAARLEPISLLIWNPREWKNFELDRTLADLTEQRVTEDVSAFLLDLKEYFGYAWP